MIEVKDYTPTRPRGGKRLVQVEKDGAIVFPVATYSMLKEMLGFTETDRKKITEVLAGDRQSVRGYKLRNIGWLVQ